MLEIINNIAFYMFIIAFFALITAIISLVIDIIGGGRDE